MIMSKLVISCVISCELTNQIKWNYYSNISSCNPCYKKYLNLKSVQGNKISMINKMKII